MNNKKPIDSKLKSVEEHSNNSREAKNGYFDRGNGSKIAAEMGTRNKK